MEVVMAQLLSVAFALLAGLLMTRVFKKLGWGFPDVTSFLIAGVLIGPYVLGRLGLPGIGFSTFEQISNVTVLSNVALGFIAFDIGNEFRLSQLRETGKTATVIGIFQAVMAALLVDLALICVHFVLGEKALPMSVAITLGAIASATAPAATLMVVRQYKAKGPVTDLLLPIVALDDAVGLIVFAVSFGIAQALEGGTLNVITIVVNPMLEIVCSLVLGAIMGWLLTQLEKLFFSNSNRLSMTISFVMMTIALASTSFHIGPVTISFSSLLVCMMLGTIFCNLCEYSGDIMTRSEKWTVPLYAVFFVLSGSQLDLGVFRYVSVILIGIVYILVRSGGKYLGALISSTAMKCNADVRRYLGITLLPQAGVALGMVVTATKGLGEGEGSLVRNTILFSVLVYELVGPMFTKWALTQAGEIVPASADKKTRERFSKEKQRR